MVLDHPPDDPTPESSSPHSRWEEPKLGLRIARVARPPLLWVGVQWARGFTHGLKSAGPSPMGSVEVPNEMLLT